MCSLLKNTIVALHGWAIQKKCWSEGGPSYEMYMTNMKDNDLEEDTGSHTVKKLWSDPPFVQKRGFLFWCAQTVGLHT